MEQPRDEVSAVIAGLLWGLVDAVRELETPEYDTLERPLSWIGWVFGQFHDRQRAIYRLEAYKKVKTELERRKTTK